MSLTKLPSYTVTPFKGHAVKVGKKVYKIQAWAGTIKTGTTQTPDKYILGKDSKGDRKVFKVSQTLKIEYAGDAVEEGALHPITGKPLTDAETVSMSLNAARLKPEKPVEGKLMVELVLESAGADLESTSLWEFGAQVRRGAPKYPDRGVCNTFHRRLDYQLWLPIGRLGFSGF